jgi:long-chain fatty acid transport protein
MADLAGYYHWKGYTLGGAFYVPNGQFIDWKDTVMESSGEIIRAKYFNLFLLSVTNLSIAREIIPGVMLGGGINFLIGSFELDVNKHVVGSKIQDYAFGIDSEGLGYGLEGIFGLLVKPTDWFSIGAVYRTGGNINVDGHLHVLQTPVPDIPTGYDAASDYKQDFPLPPTWGIGIAFEPSQKLTFTLDAQGTDWTVMKTEIDYDNQRRGGFSLPNINEKLHWNISWRYRAGIEYLLNERWAIQAGYAYDENAIPDEASSLTTINGLTMQIASVGASYSWGSWGIGFHFDTHWYYERVDNRSTGGQDYLWGLSLTKRF